MSEDTVSVEERSLPSERVAAWSRRHYDYLVLAALMAFMLWVRLQSYGRFVRNGEVFFSGNDPYYHLREVTYTVKHWPATMPFDPWTFYPYGTSIDAFGTVFDQLIATAALVWGLGSPTETVVAKTLLLAPAVFGTLVAVPAYFIGRRLGGRFGGLFGVVILALLPGSFLRRGLVGTGDHQIAEVLFQAVAVLGVMVALAVAEREKPVWELLVDRDLDALRHPLGWGVLGGVAVALYVWVWPPAVLLMGIFGAFVVVKMLAEYHRGYSPEPVAFAAVTVMGTAGLLSLLPMRTVTFLPTKFGLLQPTFALGIAAGAAALAWLAREWDDRGLDRELYSVAVGGVLLVGVVGVFLAVPGAVDTVLAFSQRFVGFSAGAETRTIGEAQPFLSQVNSAFGITATDIVFREYGAMFFTAAAALVYIVFRPLLRSRERTDHVLLVGAPAVVAVVWLFDVGPWLLSVLPVSTEPVLVEVAIVGAVVAAALVRGNQPGEEMFVVVWALFITSAAFTQVRFNYYLAVVVVALNAYAVGRLMTLIGIVRTDGRLSTEIEPYQIMALMLALLVIVPGLVVPVQIGQAGGQSISTNTGMAVGNSTGPAHVTRWDGTLTWLRDETPEEGTWGGADGSLPYYGTYDRPADGDFDYPAGTYGVMSWWDYGHWITVEGERIPNANPFQQGATTAANFLLAPSEQRASSVLGELGDEGEQTRYVMVDWKMVDADSRSAKFSAPTVFYDAEENVSTGDFLGPVIYQQSGQQFSPVFRPKEQRYFESMAVRLYTFHGSRASAQPYVLDWETTTAFRAGEPIEIRVTPSNGKLVKRFRTMADARAYVRNDSTSRIGGYGTVPSESVPALQHYRLVKASESMATSSGSYVNSAISKLRALNVSQRQVIRNPNWVKVFERVPGATVVGTAPANTTVTARVQMKMTTVNRTFTYTQQAKTGADGRFELTLPYSTEGYDNYGPANGHTNVSVRAVGPYRLTTPLQQNETALYQHAATVNVTEAQVVGDDTSTIRTELERQPVLDIGGGNNTTDGGNNTTTPTNNSSASLLTTRPLDADRDGAPSADGPAPLGRDSRHPANPVARGGLFGLALVGLLLDVRDR